MLAALLHPRRWYDLAREDRRRAATANPDATFLVAYPKAGITWLQFMLTQLLAQAYHIDLGKLTVKLVDFSREHPQVPRVIRSHDEGDILHEDGRRPDPWPLFIYGGRQRYRNSRVILLVRDPRDIVVSYYHQATKRSANAMTFSSLSEFVRDPLYGLPRVMRFYRVWHRQRHVPRELLLVRYEDLMSNGPEVLERILAFLRAAPLSREAVERIYADSQADKMRDLEKSGQVEGMRLFGQDTNALKVRKARIGGFREELDQADIAFCNRLVRRFPKDYQYSV